MSTSLPLCVPVDKVAKKESIVPEQLTNGARETTEAAKPATAIESSSNGAKLPNVIEIKTDNNSLPNTKPVAIIAGCCSNMDEFDDESNTVCFRHVSDVRIVYSKSDSCYTRVFKPWVHLIWQNKRLVVHCIDNDLRLYFSGHIEIAFSPKEDFIYNIEFIRTVKSVKKWDWKLRLSCFIIDLNPISLSCIPAGVAFSISSTIDNKYANMVKRVELLENSGGKATQKEEKHTQLITEILNDRSIEEDNDNESDTKLEPKNKNETCILQGSKSFIIKHCTAWDFTILLGIITYGTLLNYIYIKRFIL